MVILPFDNLILTTNSNGNGEIANFFQIWYTNWEIMNFEKDIVIAMKISTILYINNLYFLHLFNVIEAT